MTNIKATNIELENETREYIEKRLEGMKKFVAGREVDHVYLDVGRTSMHHKQGDVYRAEFNVVIDGKKYTALSETYDLHRAIDEAYDGLVREIKDGKEYTMSILRRGARSVKKMLKGISKRNPETSLVE